MFANQPLGKVEPKLPLGKVEPKLPLGKVEPKLPLRKVDNFALLFLKVDRLKYKKMKRFYHNKINYHKNKNHVDNTIYKIRRIYW